MGDEADHRADREDLSDDDGPAGHVLPDEVEYPERGEGGETALPRRVETWRRRSAAGAMLTGFAFGLREALEPNYHEPAIVLETSGVPPKDLPVEADLDNVPPRQSVVRIRRWLLTDSPGGAAHDDPAGDDDAVASTSPATTSTDDTTTPVDGSPPGRAGGPAPRITEIRDRAPSKREIHAPRASQGPDLMFSNMLSPSGPEPGANPSLMKRSEVRQAGVVAVIVGVVAVLDLTVKTGSGAPVHANVWAPAAGLVLAVALVVSLRWRNRLVSPFLAIFGGFFVTLAKAPKSLSIPHIVALVAAVGFALTVSLRQRREQKALTPNMSGADRRAAADAQRRRRKGEPEAPEGPKRPAPSARYTPPKSRTTPKR